MSGEPGLECSVVEVVAAGGGSAQPRLLLASCGRGDLHLIAAQEGSHQGALPHARPATLMLVYLVRTAVHAAWLATPSTPRTAAPSSPAVYPLRPTPPLAGVRPFMLEGAYLAANGEQPRCRGACRAAHAQQLAATRRH